MTLCRSVSKAIYAASSWSPHIHCSWNKKTFLASQIASAALCGSSLFFFKFSTSNANLYIASAVWGMIGAFAGATLVRIIEKNFYPISRSN
jgi:hypothetical protein